jgi:hypothetical protein
MHTTWCAACDVTRHCGPNVMVLSGRLWPQVANDVFRADKLTQDANDLEVSMVDDYAAKSTQVHHRNIVIAAHMITPSYHQPPLCAQPFSFTPSPCPAHELRAGRWTPPEGYRDLATVLVMAVAVVSADHYVQGGTCP